MKKIFLISFMVLLLTEFVQAVAVQAAEIPSDAVTSFFGEYESSEETPEDPNSHKTVDSADNSESSPADSGGTQDITNYYTETGLGTQQQNREKQQILPATGSDYMNLFQFAGVSLIVTAWLILQKGKNDEKKNVEMDGRNFSRRYDF